MGTRIMKTTIDITDDLVVKAKELAAKRGSTLRAIIEQGIRMTLEDEKDFEEFQLPDKSVQGNGLQREFRNKSWSDLREAAYEGHGG